MKNLNKKSVLSIAILSALSLSACNIDLQLSEEQKQSINKTATGIIDTFGSLRVNGVEYNTQNAVVLKDGSSAEPSDLKKGMLVTVTGTENSNGTGVASTVEFEDITEGEVLANLIDTNQTLNVMGQTVYVDDSTVFASNQPTITNLKDIDPGNVLEVSGYTSGDGEIWATRIEFKDDGYASGNEIEVKGKIENLTETTFDIGNLTVNYENAQFEYLNGQLEENMYVEVSSYQSLNGENYMLADSIELKGNGEIEVKYSNNDQEVEIKGLITNVISDSEIEVNGARVLINSQTKFEHGLANQFENGQLVEVEGYVDGNGNFHADEIEFENYSDNDRDDDFDSDDDQDDSSDDDDDSDDHDESENESDDD